MLELPKERRLREMSEVTPACEACPVENPPALSPLATSDRSGAMRLSADDELLRGACAGGDSYGRGGTDESGRAEEEAHEGGRLVCRTPPSSFSSSLSSSLSSSAAAAIPASDEGLRPHDPQSQSLPVDAEAAPFAPGGKKGEGERGEVEEREQWERGLRRMVDGEAPSVSQPYARMHSENI